MGKKKFQWEAGSGEPRDQPPAPRNRTANKREADAVDRLVTELVALPDHELVKLPLGDPSIEAVRELRRLERRNVRGGLRRQRLAAASLLRREDLDPVRAAMPAHGGVSPRELALQHVEGWRMRLLRDGDPALDALLEERPDADRQRLRQLIRQATRDAVSPEERHGKAYREIFALLRELFVT